MEGMKRVKRTETIHSPHAGNDVHWQHDRSEHRESAKNIVGLLRALVHADVDLSEIVGVGAG